MIYSKIDNQFAVKHTNVTHTIHGRKASFIYTLDTGIIFTTVKDF